MRPTCAILQSLCLQCGLCCNGGLFRDVELQTDDAPARLKALGLPVKTARGKTRLPQPCAALDGYLCRIYATRPERCRQFDCAVLAAVRDESVSPEAAARAIRQTRRLLGRVEQCLSQLGEDDAQAPVQLRFRRMVRRLEAEDTDAKSAEWFGRLTVAWHALNLRLHDRFLSCDSEAGARPGRFV
jgi:Fe-S-cluster containining protein